MIGIMFFNRPEKIKKTLIFVFFSCIKALPTSQNPVIAIYDTLLFICTMRMTAHTSKLAQNV